MFDIIFDDKGTGYVFTPNGYFPLKSMGEYDLFVRVKRANMTPDTMLSDTLTLANVQEIIIMMRDRLVPFAAPTGTATVDPAALKAAVDAAMPTAPQIAELVPAPAPIDYAALAKAVNDDAAKRMQS